MGSYAGLSMCFFFLLYGWSLSPLFASVQQMKRNAGAMAVAAPAAAVDPREGSPSPLPPSPPSSPLLSFHCSGVPRRRGLAAGPRGGRSGEGGRAERRPGGEAGEATVATGRRGSRSGGGVRPYKQMKRRRLPCGDATEAATGAVRTRGRSGGGADQRTTTGNIYMVGDLQNRLK